MDTQLPLNAILISGGVWATRPVSEVPSIVLQDWAVIELADGDRHFAGYNITEGEGRASSKIVEFDPATMRGVTSTGRVYELDGPPGLRGDGLYTWNRWARINSVEDKFTDISGDLYAQTYPDQSS